jgi:hypothetical protein
MVFDQHQKEPRKMRLADQIIGAAAKKPPLTEFIVTRLNLSRGTANRGVALGLSREAARKHPVRGHFNVRKTGIYWWSPFPRGTDEPIQRTRYAVVGTSAAAPRNGGEAR